MANLKEIRNRISSVQSTMQITSAMKMVSAAKLKRAQSAVEQMQPYAAKLQEIGASLSASSDLSENEFIANRESKSVLLVAITSNRGLCGGFNNNVIKETLRLIEEMGSDKEVKVLPIGKKAEDAFKRTSHAIKVSYLPQQLNHVWNALTFEAVTPIAEQLIQAYIQKQLDHIILVCNHFKNVSTQVVQPTTFLPLTLPDRKEDEASAHLDHIFEPSRAEIMKELIPQSLKVQLYAALLDSYAGEHGARMTAMHKATDNASELSKELKLVYNKARQAAITNEILEIVGGAEALSA